VDRSGLPRGVDHLIRLSEEAPDKAPRKETSPAPFVERVGIAATRFFERSREMLEFVGQVVPSLVRFATFRAQFRRTDLVQHVSEAGAQALPIIALVSVIIGLILAFVGAVQLRLFGADLYVANLVGVAMVREMGAMVVGIILAGRTGAAYAAQLGTMKVTEESDALTTFGISTIDFLVTPRIVALFVMTPFLCLYSIVLGILGGALVGVFMLGLSPKLYFDQTVSALTLSDLWGGVFRSAVYGALVAITGCLRGVQSGTNAAAVGAATTSAVVTAIVAIIVADGVMAVLFNILGI
jgi:phospholipid/cholesterol/gamma-HCH transport system permease protein